MLASLNVGQLQPAIVPTTRGSHNITAVAVSSMSFITCHLFNKMCLNILHFSSFDSDCSSAVMSVVSSPDIKQNINYVQLGLGCQVQVQRCYDML